MSVGRGCNRRLFVVGIILALAFNCCVVTGAQAALRTEWVQTSNPSDTDDSAWSIAVDASGVYIAGDDLSQGNLQWRIEKRSLTDGSLLWTQVENPSASADSIWQVAVDGSGIYMVGYDSYPGDLEWRIEKRNLADGELLWTQANNPSAGADFAYDVGVDASGIYVVGIDASKGDDEWRIEKRSLTDGELIWTQTSNPSAGVDWAVGVAVDASGIYVVGYDTHPRDLEWRIEKRSLTDGELIWTQMSNPTLGEASGIYLGDRAFGVAADSSGLYVVGFDNFPAADDVEWRIEKRALTNGELLWAQTENLSPREDRAFSVAVGSSGIYVIGFDSPGPGDLEWRIEKRSQADGEILWNQTRNPSVDEDWGWAIAVDVSGIYVTGSDSAQGLLKWEWRVEKIVEETDLPFYVQPWFTVTIIVIAMVVVFSIVVVLKRKAVKAREKPVSVS